MILYDVKLIDPAKHRFYTGVDNREILVNLLALFREFPSKILVRYPLIPSINDTPRDIELLIDFLRNLPEVRIEFLAYHRLGVVKYARIGKAYQLEGLVPSQKEDVEKVKKEVAEVLPSVKIVGE